MQNKRIATSGDFHSVRQTAAANRARRATDEAKRQAEMLEHFHGIEDRLRKVPDARRTDLLISLPSAIMAGAGVIMTALVMGPAWIVLVQVGLFLPVAYKIVRKL